MPERLECEVLQKARYINTLTFYLSTFTFRYFSYTSCFSFPSIPPSLRAATVRRRRGLNFRFNKCTSLAPKILGVNFHAGRPTTIDE